MKEKPLCGYCYKEVADDCCDKRRIDVLERQLEELDKDNRALLDSNLELIKELDEAREAICIHVREHMDTAGIENDDDAVIYFKKTFNEENYN